MAPVSAQESEENFTSVADCIKHTVDEVKALTGRKTTNGPDATVASKTAASVQMIADGVKTLDKNIHVVNANFIVDLKSCMTGQVESLHSTHHHKHEAGAHLIDYARAFGNSIKEGLKRTNIRGTYYFTNNKSLSCTNKFN